MRIPWRFRDTVLSESYFLPVNPTADSGSFALKKNTRYQVSASNYVDTTNVLRIGDTVAQDAPSEQERFSYTGSLYTKEQIEAFEYWFNKNYPWYMRDDLMREHLIYPEQLTLERARSHQYRWKHTYTFTGLVLMEVSY